MTNELHHWLVTGQVKVAHKRPDGSEGEHTERLHVHVLATSVEDAVSTVRRERCDADIFGVSHLGRPVLISDAAQFAFVAILEKGQ